MSSAVPEPGSGTGQGCVAHQRGAGSGEAPGPGRSGEVGSGARVEGGEAVQLVDGLVAGVVPGPRILHEALADVRQRGALARAGQDCEADEAGLTVGRLQLLQVHEHFEINTSFSDNFINY